MKQKSLFILAGMLSTCVVGNVSFTRGEDFAHMVKHIPSAANALVLVRVQGGDFGRLQHPADGGGQMGPVRYQVLGSGGDGLLVEDGVPQNSLFEELQIGQYCGGVGRLVGKGNRAYHGRLSWSKGGAH